VLSVHDPADGRGHHGLTAPDRETETRSARHRGRVPTLLGWAAASLVAFLVLGWLVSRGELTGLDTYALRHWMETGEAYTTSPTNRFGDLLGYSATSFHLGRALRVPASTTLSSLLVVLLAAVLWRRGRRGAAVLWLVAFGVVSLAEGAGKWLIARPPVYAMVGGTMRPAGFLHSFPSGHTARAAIIAALATAAWPRLWPVFAAWVFVVAVSLEIDAVHTPSDIAGGLLLAAGVILVGLALQASYEDRRESALRWKRLKTPSSASTETGGR
jgi:membrane-associated phospholipid phosphatase